MQKERERLKDRYREIDDMFLSLYIDKVKGVLSEQWFMNLTVTMVQEQEENRRRLQGILVGEIKKVYGQKTQEVRIVFNFVGEKYKYNFLFKNRFVLIFKTFMEEDRYGNS